MWPQQQQQQQLQRRELLDPQSAHKGHNWRCAAFAIVLSMRWRGGGAEQQRERGSWGRMTDSSTERDPAKAANRMYFLHSLQVSFIYLCFIIFFYSHLRLSLSPALFAIRVIPLTTNASFEFILILHYNNPILSFISTRCVRSLYCLPLL